MWRKVEEEEKEEEESGRGGGGGNFVERSEKVKEKNYPKG